jgi:hypothetical protein
MSVKIAVVCEAASDFVIAAKLSDRLICENIHWIEIEVIENYRTYVGAVAEEPFLTWARAKSEAAVIGLRIRGHFGGIPGELDAKAARRAIDVIRRRRPDIDAIMLVRDDDRLTARRKGLEQARSESDFGPRIVIGLAHCKRECWVLAGFVPENESESQRLGELQRQLGFHPCREAHELTAVEHGSKRDAKRVLRILSEGNAEREVSCWTDSPLDTLRTQGARTGLPEFLSEVESILLPLLGWNPR